MQRFLTTTFLLVAGMMLSGDGYAQQTPAASTPAATTPAAPAATTPKAATTAKTPAKKTGTAAATALTTQKQKFSYALGMNIGKNLGDQLKKQSVDVDWSLVAKGLRESTSGGKTLLTEDEAKAVLTAVQTDIQKKQTAKTQETATKNKTEGEVFLVANK